MQDIETARQQNILKNKDRLRELGIFTNVNNRSLQTTKKKSEVNKRRKLDSLPASRSSARIASIPTKPAYQDPADHETKTAPAISQRGVKVSKTKERKDDTAEGQQKTNGRTALPKQDIETIRSGWTSWKPVASPPSRDETTMAFSFKGIPDFTPNKSPEEMLREGCFGGSYFRSLFSNYLQTTIEDDYLELPKAWYDGLDTKMFLTAEDYNPEVNKYKVKCGQSIEEWEAAGWIDHRHDVRGWFQWYCRFFQGRRCDDDERQVSRWRKCVGPTGRWRRMLLKKYVNMGVREVFDDGEDDEKGDVSPVMHQTCFQWAYEIRQPDLDQYWKTGT